MNIKCCCFRELSNIVKLNNNKIIMFGAGVIGQITVPKLLSDMSLLEYVDCYVDNDNSKWESNIHIYGKRIKIKSPDYLKLCDEKTIIIINISRFSEVIKQLEELLIFKNIDVYIAPMMFIHEYCSKQTDEAVLCSKSRIPKKIHYMWLGGKEIPDNLKQCIKTWRKYCPDYEIVEWNESNYDIDKHPYMRQAYDAKAYGFVPDYARLDILYNEGGIYLDTDVEIIRNIDDMLCQEAFCGVEKWQVLNFGGMSGAVKGHPMIKKFLDARERVMFIDSDGHQNRQTCGFYDTPVLLNEGYQINGQTQNINGMNVYAYDYFHPYDYMSGILNKTDNTRSIHWFNGGWLDEKMREENEKVKMEYKKLYMKSLSY